MNGLNNANNSIFYVNVVVFNRIDVLIIDRKTNLFYAMWIFILSKSRIIDYFKTLLKIRIS